EVPAPRGARRVACHPRHRSRQNRFRRRIDRKLRGIAGRVRVRESSLTDDQRWRPAVDLVWTHYDDSEDWVVFHPQSGDVYLVTSAAPPPWALVAGGSASTLHQLIPALAAALNRPPDDELATVTRHTL